MTLLEVMIVIFIIGIIGSVIGYNTRGSLDEGKAFKTKEAISKLYEISQLIASDGVILSKEPKDIEKILKDSGLVRKAKDLMNDGWNNPFIFDIDPSSNELRPTSAKYTEYCLKKNKTCEYPWD